VTLGVSWISAQSGNETAGLTSSVYVTGPPPPTDRVEPMTSFFSVPIDVSFFAHLSLPLGITTKFSQKHHQCLKKELDGPDDALRRGRLVREDQHATA
jgi:hypothetical protein